MPIAADRLDQAEVTQLHPEILVRVIGSAVHLPVVNVFVEGLGLSDKVMVAFDNAGRLNIVGSLGGFGSIRPDPYVEPDAPSNAVSARIFDDILEASINYRNSQAAIAEYLAENPLSSDQLLPGTIRGYHVFPGVLAGDVIHTGTLSADRIIAHDITSAELASLEITVGYHIQSSNFVENESGWHINGAGDVEFGSGLFRGTIQTGVEPDFRAVISPRPSADYIGESLGIRWIDGVDNMDGSNVTAFIDAEAGTTANPINRLSIHAHNDNSIASVELEAEADGDSVVAIAADKVSWRVGTVPLEFHVRRRIPPREGICAVWFADV